jgi:hypothetical protein
MKWPTKCFIHMISTKYEWVPHLKTIFKKSKHGLYASGKALVVSLLEIGLMLGSHGPLLCNLYWFFNLALKTCLQQVGNTQTLVIKSLWCGGRSWCRCMVAFCLLAKFHEMKKEKNHKWNDFGYFSIARNEGKKKEKITKFLRMILNV